MKYYKARDNKPKLFEKGKLYSPIRDIWVNVEVVRNPVEEDGFLYWHFTYPNSDQKGWAKIMPDDLWKLEIIE